MMKNVELNLAAMMMGGSSGRTSSGTISNSGDRQDFAGLLARQGGKEDIETSTKASVPRGENRKSEIRIKDERKHDEDQDLSQITGSAACVGAVPESSPKAPKIGRSEPSHVLGEVLAGNGRENAVSDVSSSRSVNPGLEAACKKLGLEVTPELDAILQLFVAQDTPGAKILPGRTGDGESSGDILRHLAEMFSQVRAAADGGSAFVANKDSSGSLADESLTEQRLLWENLQKIIAGNDSGRSVAQTSLVENDGQQIAGEQSPSQGGVSLSVLEPWLEAVAAVEIIIEDTIPGEASEHPLAVSGKHMRELLETPVDSTTARDAIVSGDQRSLSITEGLSHVLSGDDSVPSETGRLSEKVPEQKVSESYSGKNLLATGLTANHEAQRNLLDLQVENVRNNSETKPSPNPSPSLAGGTVSEPTESYPLPTPVTSQSSGEVITEEAMVDVKSSYRPLLGLVDEAVSEPTGSHSLPTPVVSQSSGEVITEEAMVSSNLPLRTVLGKDGTVALKQPPAHTLFDPQSLGREGIVDETEGDVDLLPRQSSDPGGAAESGVTMKGDAANQSLVFAHSSMKPISLGGKRRDSQTPEMFSRRRGVATKGRSEKVETLSRTGTGEIFTSGEKPIVFTGISEDTAGGRRLSRNKGLGAEFTVAEQVVGDESNGEARYRNEIGKPVALNPDTGDRGQSGLLAMSSEERAEALLSQMESDVTGAENGLKSDGKSVLQGLSREDFENGRRAIQASSRHLEHSLSSEGMRVNLAEHQDKGGIREAGGTSSRLPISDESLMEQIKAGLVGRTSERRTVTIKLWPENLGKIDVRLTMKNHELAATFLVEQAEVKDAMLRKLDNLKESLQLRGIELRGIEVKVAATRSGSGPGMDSGGRQFEGGFGDQQQHSGAGGFSGQSPRSPYYYRGGGLRTMGERVAGSGERAMMTSENRPNTEAGLHIMA